MYVCVLMDRWVNVCARTSRSLCVVKCLFLCKYTTLNIGNFQREHCSVKQSENCAEKHRRQDKTRSMLLTLHPP